MNFFTNNNMDIAKDCQFCFDSEVLSELW